MLRIVNMAGDDIALKTSDGDPKDGFVIRKKTIAVITKKVKSPLPVLFSASPKADETKTFFINYKAKLELKPIVTRDANAPVTLTLTKNGENQMKAQLTLERSYLSARVQSFSLHWREDLGSFCHCVIVCSCLLTFGSLQTRSMIGEQNS